MTAHGSIESAVEAMKLGARDYLQKPFEVDELLVIARRAIEDQRARLGLRYLLDERDVEFGHYGIVGNSRAVRELLARAERVAESRSTVLLTGETGTGKELVARAIHSRSAQRDRPLDQGELRRDSRDAARIRAVRSYARRLHRRRLVQEGTVRARRRRHHLPRRDRDRSAHPVQAKLLRVLQEREFEPLGSERTEKVDVRVIAATNRDLRQLVADGRFQEDLYYRLNVIPITLPPLRDRREDIPLLVDHFVRRFASSTGKRIAGVERHVLDELTQYDWPGNVRELENTIERAVVLAGGPMLTHETVWLMGAVAPAQGTGLPSLRLHQNVEWAERETIKRALERSRGVKKDAAELMGISQRALSHYLLKYKDSL